MATMGRYVKAYTAATLSGFDAFAPNLDALRPADDGGARDTLADDDILFVHEDFAVTDGIYRDENVIFEPDTDAWKSFCTDTLGFAVPEDVASLPAG